MPPLGNAEPGLVRDDCATSVPEDARAGAGRGATERACRPGHVVRVAECLLTREPYILVAHPPVDVSSGEASPCVLFLSRPSRVSLAYRELQSSLERGLATTRALGRIGAGTPRVTAADPGCRAPSAVR